MDQDSLFRMNAHLWTLLNAAFDLSAFTVLCSTFSAAHEYKFLLRVILLYNRTQGARVLIINSIWMMPTSLCSDSEELAAPVVAYSVLHNALMTSKAILILTQLQSSCMR